MKKVLSRLVWVPFGLILVWFLVANRQLVAISLDPISTKNPAVATPALPLWIWLAAALLCGVFTGAAGMWASSRPSRQRARADKRELKALRQELTALKTGRPAETLPSLDAQED